MGIPGEKFLGKDKDGWEYTSHDLWRKKMIWKPEYKKIWRIEKKQEWVNILLSFLLSHTKTNCIWADHLMRFSLQINDDL